MQAANTNEVIYLLDAGANVNRPGIWHPWGANRSYDHQTALTTACLQGNAGMAELLLARGADPNRADGFKRTPLVAAMSGKNLGCVKHIVEAGGAFRVAGQNVLTLFAPTSTESTDAIDQYLLNNGAGAALTGDDIRHFCYGYKGRPAVFAWFFENKDVDINSLFWTTRSSNIDFFNLIHISIIRGNTNVISTLIDHGAKVNMIGDDPAGTTPLVLAAGMDSLDVVTLLVEHGADVSLKANYGSDPIHSAAHRGHTDILRYLLDRAPPGALDVTDKYGLTALHLACGSHTSDLECIQLLLDSGASLDRVDTRKNRPLDYAREALTYAQDKVEKQKIIDHLSALNTNQE